MTSGFPHFRIVFVGGNVLSQASRWRCYSLLRSRSALRGPTAEAAVDVGEADVCVWRNRVAAYIVIIPLQVISSVTNQTDVLCLHTSKEQG